MGTLQPALVLFATALVTLGACGARTTGIDGSGTPGGGPTSPDAKSCGDGQCAGGESCTTCPLDCGRCAGCGDNRCSADETCSSCPTDCGVCDACGDGFCKDGENCLSCAPDCGSCPSCGDKTCDRAKEDCFSCPDDCGACSGCGNGVCASPETCASCSGDCGVCAVCGNSRCEAPYETCANCHADCGDCESLGCTTMLTCSLGCIDLNSRPPGVRVSCLGTCIAKGCADAQFMFDRAFNCFLKNFERCGTNFGCLTGACQAEVAACTAANCP